MDGLVLLTVFYIPYGIRLGSGAEVLQDLESAVDISCRESGKTSLKGRRML